MPDGFGFDKFGLLVRTAYAVDLLEPDVRVRICQDQLPWTKSARQIGSWIPLTKVWTGFRLPSRARLARTILRLVWLKTLLAGL